MRDEVTRPGHYEEARRADEVISQAEIAATPFVHRHKDCFGI